MSQKKWQKACSINHRLVKPIFFRAILRERQCLHRLLEQLTSPSLTIVSNACGTLWNFSARCPEDQQALWDMTKGMMLETLSVVEAEGAWGTLGPTGSFSVDRDHALVVCDQRS